MHGSLIEVDGAFGSLTEGVLEELVDRVRCGEFGAWRDQRRSLGYCGRPIRLVGQTGDRGGCLVFSTAGQR
jgi:hypothetical protein